MYTSRLYSIALYFLVAVLGYLSYQLFKPFLSPLAWPLCCLLCFILFLPLFLFVKWKPIASFITMLIILVILLGPFSYLSYVLTQEIRSLIDEGYGGKFDPMGGFLNHPFVGKLINKILAIFNLSQGEFENN